MKKTLAILLCVLTLFTASACAVFDGIDGVASFFPGKEYGDKMEKSGVTYYVDRDGVATAELKADEIAWMSVENSDGKVLWIGMEANGKMLDRRRAVCFRVKPLSQTSASDEERKCFDRIDPQIDFKTVTHIRVEDKYGDAVEDPDFDCISELYIQAGSSDLTDELMLVDIGSDERLPAVVVEMNAPDGETGHFFRLRRPVSDGYYMLVADEGEAEPEDPSSPY